MHSHSLFKPVSFLASIALVLASGCGEEPTGRNNPVGPTPLAGVGVGAAGMVASVAGTGAAGRAPLGPTAPTGAAGRPAAVGGAGTPSLGAAGTGAAGMTASAGASGKAGTGAVAGTGASTAGMMAMAGTGSAGMMGQAGTGSTMMGTGTCCADGNCLCRAEPPAELSTRNGPYQTRSMRIASGTLYYPTDAEPPFAAVGICGGFLNTGPEMESWGPMYASHGIVTVIVTTTGADIPEIRAQRLLDAVKELEMINGDMSSPLGGKLAGRYGTSGYSMGGGGTTLAAGQNAMLKTTVGLAPWGGDGSRVQPAAMFLCGDADAVAPCAMSDALYRAVPEATPKMMITFRGATHFSWFGPGDAGRGESGAYALAFQKVYLEGDERWKKLLTAPPQNGTVVTNIK